jgi:hypothetical protein
VIWILGSARVVRGPNGIYRAKVKKSAGSGQLKQIERGAYLHDIGKIGIPDSVLLKPGKVTAEEWEIMRTHARVGYELGQSNRVLGTSGRDRLDPPGTLRR